MVVLEAAGEVDVSLMAVADMNRMAVMVLELGTADMEAQVAVMAATDRPVVDMAETLTGHKPMEAAVVDTAVDKATAVEGQVEVEAVPGSYNPPYICMVQRGDEWFLFLSEYKICMEFKQSLLFFHFVNVSKLLP